jgi:hypothetical protein
VYHIAPPQPMFIVFIMAHMPIIEVMADSWATKLWNGASMPGP